MNIGEEICGEWLRHAKGCEFVQYNLKTPEMPGEIDVIGLNLKHRTVYACEVAVHLITGLQYVKNKRPDNVRRLTTKLGKDIEYLRREFRDYDKVLMLWSPIVKDQREGSKYNQLRDVDEIVRAMRTKYGLEVQPVINETFQDALDELRKVARHETKELTSSVMRYLQVEERLRRHVNRLTQD